MSNSSLFPCWGPTCNHLLPSDLITLKGTLRDLARSRSVSTTPFFPSAPKKSLVRSPSSCVSGGVAPRVNSSLLIAIRRIMFRPHSVPVNILVTIQSSESSVQAGLLGDSPSRVADVWVEYRPLFIMDGSDGWHTLLGGTLRGSSALVTRIPVVLSFPR